MTTNTNPTEDVDGALDTLERRADHLSKRVHQTADKPPHWRDEVELRSLRIAIRSIRRVHKMADPVVIMTDAAEAMEAMISEMASQGHAIDEQWSDALDRLDVYIESNDGA